MDIQAIDTDDEATRDTIEKDGKDLDIFDKHMKSYDNSKTLKTLNFIYSLIVGILTSRLTVRLPRNKLLGILMALMSFVVSRQFLKVEGSK